MDAVNVDVIEVEAASQGKKFIRRAFPHIRFEALSVKERAWSRTELADIYGVTVSMITKDIQALMQWKDNAGKANWMGYEKSQPLSFLQGFYLYLLRVWMETQRFANENPKPLKSVFVRDYLNKWEVTLEGQPTMPTLSAFTDTVELALKADGKNLTAMQDYERLLENYLSRKKGTSALK